MLLVDFLTSSYKRSAVMIPWQDPFEEIKKVTKGKVQPSLTSSEERCQNVQTKAKPEIQRQIVYDCIQ